MPTEQRKDLFQIDLGRTRYKYAWDIQKKLVSLRANKKIPDCLIITEHEPVITMGRGTSGENLLVAPETLTARHIELYEIERGGDITFHGPGQTVFYPIIDLSARGRDVHRFLRDMEKVLISALECLGLKAGIKNDYTGVWIGDFKVGAIGVAVSRWVTYHGMALNVSVDMEYFKLINPCGIREFSVASISDILGENPGLDYVKQVLIESFARQFGYIRIKGIEDISTIL
jgi:lipoyl(octanoyl) transferase